MDSGFLASLGPGMTADQAAAGRSVSGSIVLHTDVRMSSAPQRLQA
jgi:hypothetical protein